MQRYLQHIAIACLKIRADSMHSSLSKCMLCTILLRGCAHVCQHWLLMQWQDAHSYAIVSIYGLQKLFFVRLQMQPCKLLHGQGRCHTCFGTPKQFRSYVTAATMQSVRCGNMQGYSITVKLWAVHATVNRQRGQCTFGCAKVCCMAM